MVMHCISIACHASNCWQGIGTAASPAYTPMPCISTACHASNCWQGTGTAASQSWAPMQAQLLLACHRPDIHQTLNIQ
eukprot:3951704-Lingulodinium_polyedra.AAC.1